MAQEMTLDYEQLLQDLAAAQAEPEREPGVFTRREIERIWGLSSTQAYRRLLLLCEMGLLERTWAPAPDGWGVSRPTRAYRVVVEKELSG